LKTQGIVDIESRDDPVRIAEVVNRTLERDPWFLALRDAQAVERQLKVSATLVSVDEV
jgi:hypothetical protein